MKKLEDYLYYEEKDPELKIYLGDCLEILPLLPKVDLVVTDPPYGIKLETAYRLRGRGRLAQCKNYEEIHGDDKKFDPNPFLQFKYAVLFGANYYCDLLPPSSGWLIWDKREGQAINDQADCEIAWTNFVKGARVFRHMWNGFLRDSERGESYHPTQKPVALIRWIYSLRWTPPDLTTLDPFMGSGTTLVACKELNRNGIGIEISEKYCEIAKKRLKATCRPLFTDVSGAKKSTKENDGQKDMLFGVA